MRISRILVFALPAAFCAAALLAQSALTSLGLKEPDAGRQAVRSLAEGRVPVYQASAAFRAADPATRAGLVLGVLAWVKSYTQSPACKAEYDRQREQNRPEPPKPKPSVDAELAKQKAERAQGLEEMKKNVEKMSPDMRAKMQDTIKQMESQYAKMDSDPQMAAMMRQGTEMQRAAEEKSYQERLASFEKRFPADAKTLLAQRLQQFLEASKDVDFGAQLVPDRGRKKFANAAHERKPETWKLCYRAGKEAVAAARSFAAAWLKELQ